jgi:RNA polymerase sigma-70 factor (ECF subfamily)
LYAAVARWGRRAGLQNEEVDDLLQEVFRTVSSQVANFSRQRGSGRFAAWLFCITRTRIADHYRSQEQEPAGIGSSDFQQRLEQQPAPDEGSSGGTNPTPERLLLLRRALDLVRSDFADHTWHAFWGSVIDGRDTADVARDLGLSSEMVRQARSRVLRRLRAVLGEGPE